MGHGRFATPTPRAAHGGHKRRTKIHGAPVVVGGLVGATLLWTVEHPSEAPILELLFSRGGLSWYGGLIGGSGLASHVLHTFTGAPAADPRNRRDWTLTTLWALSMDAVAAGLIVMVLGSYVMWFRLRARRLGGIVALALGSITCGAFIGGLRWLL